MRNLIVNTFLSLDGVMQAPGGPDEDPTGGFTLGGWAVPYFDEEMLERISTSGDYELLLGRGTYEIFAAHWPFDEGPIADHLNRTPQARRLEDARRARVEQLDADRGRRGRLCAELKREDGPDIQVHGSPGLIQTLLEHDLVDEFRLWIFPVVVGGGKRLFGDGAKPAALELADSTVSKTGVTINVYRRAGDVEPGLMDFDEPTDAELERRRRLAGG